MQTIYQMNADELSSDFIESLKVLFRHKYIEIAVHEIAYTTELKERRDLLATETQAALAWFRQADLMPQNSDELIAELRSDLATS